MPRNRQYQEKTPAAQEDSVDRLTQKMERLEAEMRCLRETLDRVEDDLDWAFSTSPSRQVARLPIPTPMHITSLPRDPLAADFGQRINKISPEDLCSSRDEALGPAKECPQGTGSSDSLF